VLMSSFLTYGSFLAISVLSPMYFQIALGASVSTAGFLMIPLLFSSIVTANMTGYYSRRTGRYKRPPLVGLPVAILAMVLGAALADRLSAPVAAGILLLFGAGFGPIFPCTIVAAQNAVERRHLGAVSGALGFARSLGGAIIIAAASALVLGLCAAALARGGPITSL